MLDIATAPAARAPEPQCLRALRNANARRVNVAELKARLRRGDLTLSQLVLDPPADVRGYLLFEVLRWAPCYGRHSSTKLRALNARAIRLAQVNLASELGALTPRQRRWLADQIAGRR